MVGCSLGLGRRGGLQLWQQVEASKEVGQEENGSMHFAKFCADRVPDFAKSGKKLGSGVTGSSAC